MKDETRFPRVRVHESNFSEEYKEVYNENDFYLEVINEKNEVVGLFFLYFPFEFKTDFQDAIEFAQFYDSRGYGQVEEEYYQESRERYGYDDSYSNEDMYGDGGLIEYYYKSNYSKLNELEASLFICYGRLKYPLGLSEGQRKAYMDDFDLDGIPFCNFYLIWEYEESDDWIDLFNSLLSASKYKFSKEEFNDIVDEIILGLIGCGIVIISGIAENLFTRDNIDQCIEAALGDSIFNDFNPHKDEKAEIVAFLLDYKNKHFPEDDKSRYSI